MAENGSPAPQFDTDEERSYFAISLPVHHSMLSEDQDSDLDSDLDDDLDLTESVAKLLTVLTQEENISALLRLLKIQHRPSLRKYYLTPAMELNLIEMTIPEKPTSRYQKYRLTSKGKSYQKRLKTKS